MGEQPKRGRPRSETAVSHHSILDAVFKLLANCSARELTMEAIAQRAGVGKQTLYKWWPSKTALIMAMFQERLVGRTARATDGSVADALRFRVLYLIEDFQTLFGKVIGELIAEAQSNPALLQELRVGYLDARRRQVRSIIEHGVAVGELRNDTDPDVLIDSLFAPLYHRLLLGYDALTKEFGEKLVDQVLRGVLVEAKPNSPN